MRILFIGDIFGRPGRTIVKDRLPGLVRDHAIDLVIANGENSAAGFGITPALAEELFELNIDVITTGNHVWDQRELLGTIDADPRLLRPLNLPAGTPGAGGRVFDLDDGRRVLVLNPMARLFMDAIDCPFAAVERELALHPLGDVQAVVIDFHGEATSEKMAMGHFADGRASMVVGTHSHVPTADARILTGGTAYQTDCGMCGDYDSVIGMQKEAAVARFVTKLPGERLRAADGEGTLCAVFVETDDATGLARRIEPVRLGGRLAQHVPSLAAALA
jgi:2',3'-cyclic-nucleotide 2'-phosphodiesterase